MKRFDGWEPEETHTYDYDDAGRLKSVRMSREVEWDEEQQGLMLALHQYRAQCCPQGHYLPDSAAKAAEGVFRAAATRCHMCTAVEAEAERVRDNPQPMALLYAIRKR